MSSILASFSIPQGTLSSLTTVIPSHADYIGRQEGLSELGDEVYLVSFGSVCKDSEDARLSMASEQLEPVGYLRAKAIQISFPEIQREQPVVVLAARWKRPNEDSVRVLVFPVLGSGGKQDFADAFVVDEGKWERHAAFLAVRSKSSLSGRIVVRLRLLLRFLLSWRKG
ncbi:MAG: hypothetical protein UY50_C0001G0027 [Parcubacteria group bacterium GW2011_GWA2_49_9]|nr:MAG: hypothetical protein UY50_C0001G0027 [Parcubacteria group bacterium GW2011_GWA2_49_9]